MVGPVQAESFEVFGARALGMGGAHVAVSTDGLASYWNPAGLGIARENEKTEGSQIEVFIPFGIGAEVAGNVLTVADDLQDLVPRFDRIQASQSAGGPLDADSLGSFLNGLNKIDQLNQPGTGLIAKVQAGVGFRWGKLALSINNFASLGVSVNADLVNIGLGPSVTGDLGVNFTGANASGAGFNSTQNQAALLIQNSIDNLGFSSLDSLTGNALSGSGLANSTDAANALVNFSIANGATDAQILSAANEADQQSVGLAPIIQAAALGGAYTDNESGAKLNGTVFTEIGLGYGLSLPFYEDIYVGITGKLIRGEVGFFSVDLLNDTEDISISDALDDTQTTIQPGVDLGVLWRVPFLPFDTIVGLVAKNINSPKFKQPDAAKIQGFDDFELKPQVRVGLSIKPLSQWVISVDADLTENDSILSGLDSQEIAIGTEYRLFNFSWVTIPLRLGYSQNLSNDVDKYYAGLGFYFGGFELDLAGSISSDSEEVTIDGETEDIPQNVRAVLQVSYIF